MEELAALAAISLASGFILFSSSRDAILRTKHQIRLQRRTSIEVFDSRVEEAVDAKKGLETAAATARKISTVVDPEKIKQSTEVYHALSRLREFVIRDFIDSWYRAAVSTNDDFPNQVRMAIDYAFAALAERLLKVDWAAVIVNEAISFFTDLLRYVRLTEEELLKVQEYKKAKAHDRLRLLLVEIRRKYSLHKGVDNPTDYLRKFSDDLLKSIMRESDFKCMSARTLVREVFTMNIFTPVLGFASSDFINRMISLVASKLRSAKFEDDEELDQESDGDESDHTMHSEIEKELESPVSSSKEENPFPDAVSPTEQASGLIETANFNAELSSPELESTSTFKADIIKWKYSWDIHKPYAVYFLRLSNDSLSWTLRKRFSHFIDLHSELQKTVPSFKAKFPRRNLFQFLDSMSSEFLDQRLRDLNKYLHEGIMFDSKCTDSAAWRRFISPGNDPVVEIEEQGEKQISNMTNGAQKRRSNDEFPVESQIDAADTKKNRTSRRRSRYNQNTMKPIYLLIGEIFELERKGWVQRQIGWIATYLLQSFDKKLNRLYHDKFYEFTQEENIAKIVDMINNAVWPDGVLMEGRIPFTAEQMQEHSERAREDVHDLLPKSVKSILGSEFCEARLLKLYNFFQLEPVVKHLAFSLLDKIFSHVLKKRA